jgi:DnaJ family protein C protein 13
LIQNPPRSLLLSANLPLCCRPIPLLPAACELAYYTVKVSALNAEELRRENGIEIVARAFSRCIDVISPKTTPQETSVQVCTHLVYLFGAAAQFEKCREMVAQNVSIVKNACRCLYFKGAPLLSIGTLECVSSFAVDTILQNLVSAGRVSVACGC